MEYPPTPNYKTTTNGYDCYPDKLWVTENNCLDESNFTGIYDKLPEGDWPRTLSIGLDQGDDEAGFGSGFFIRVDNNETGVDVTSCHQSYPIYQRSCSGNCNRNQFIYGAIIDSTFKWAMSNQYCSSSNLSYFYDPAENNNVQKFWELEVPLFRKRVGFKHSYNENTDKIIQS